MDVDGASISNPPAAGDIDQNLLLQFSCMNTTDREELIRQMQRLLGPTLNYNSASFFLDMSNWNLQAAICSYLDYTVPPKLPSMSLKSTQGSGTGMRPGSSFEQTWTIANTGEEGWPGSCRIMQAGGEPLGAFPVYVAALPPGQSTTVTMQLKAPDHCGMHRGFFHMVNERDEQIGDTLWAEVTVETESMMALADQLAALPVPSSRIQDMIGPQMPSSDDHMC